MKPIKSYEIENEIVYFHGEEELEANLSDVITELEEITGNEISEKDGKLYEDIDLDYHLTEEEKKYYSVGNHEVEIDNIEYACQNVISNAELSKSIGKLKNESKLLIESLKNL